MNWTNNTYETTVVNPECEPEDYNPGTQYHNPISWCADAQSRQGYEDVCSRCQVIPHTDVEIFQAGYGLKYAEYSQEQWQSRSRETRVLFKLDAIRLSGIEAEHKPKPQTTKMVTCDCGHTVSNDLVMNASMGTSCPDCYDGMSD